MKTLFVSGWRSVLIGISGMLALSACVNDEYDLSKDIDTEMTLLKNVSMPLGSFEKVSISEILTLDESEESIISKNNDGDFIFSFTGDEISADIEVPSFRIAQSGVIHTEPIEVHFSTGPAAGMNAGVITENIVYSQITGKPLDSSMDIELDADLPAEIIDVKSVILDAAINLNFTVQGGAVNLKEGFVLDFPEFLNVVKSNMSDTRFELIDNHKVMLKQDVKVSSASPLVFSLKLDKMNIPSGVVSDGILAINEKVKVTGDFYLSPSDFSIIPEKLVISIKADITGLDVVSAEVKLAVDEKISGSTMELDNLPDFLSGGDICLDIYNPTLSFDILNDTPLSFGIKTGITGTRGNKEVNILLGEKPEINIPAESDVRYVLTRREQASVGTNHIVVPELGEMISMLPETISIDDISLSSSGEDYIQIISGNSYKASVAYEVYAPLAFDQNMKISFDQKVTDLGLDLGISLSAISASMNIENSIPLDFTIAAKALDSDGKVMNDIDVTVSKAVAAGTHTSPVTTEVTLMIKSKSGVIAFDGLHLSMKANGSSALTGVALNENQGFDIKDLIITLPEGITFTDTDNE